jgi:hypothetical protein
VQQIGHEVQPKQAGFHHGPMVLDSGLLLQIERNWRVSVVPIAFAEYNRHAGGSVAMLFINRISSSISSSIWRPETAPRGSSRSLLRHRFQSCNTSLNAAPSNSGSGGIFGRDTQPYLQLARVLRESGDNPGARRVLVAMENSRRVRGNLRLLSLIWQWVKRVGIGYGYRPWYALLCGTGVALIGAFLFCLGFRAGAITPTDKDAFQIFEKHSVSDQHSSSLEYYPGFYSLAFSLDTFLPIINLGEKDHWRPNLNKGVLGEFLLCWLWIEIGLGWLLTTLFVAGLTPIIRSG